MQSNGVPCATPTKTSNKATSDVTFIVLIISTLFGAIGLRGERRSKARLKKTSGDIIVAPGCRQDAPKHG
jgi:hypothetical protein